MICPVVPFPVTLSDPYFRFQRHGVIFRPMNALDVLCAQLTRDLFAIAKFLLTIGRLLLHCWYSLGRHVTTGTPMVIFVLFWVFLTIGTVYHSSKTVKTAQKWLLVYQSSHVYQDCTNSVTISLPIVNKNLAIANRSRVSCAQYVEGSHRPIYHTVTLKSR